MRRFLSLFTMLMLCGVLAFAQTRVVSGKVTDKDGNPVSFATIKLKGSNIGTQADASGAFSIKVKEGALLEISAAGYNTSEVNVGTKTIIVEVLERNSGKLEEVVVTAMGIRRQPKELGYATTRVSSEDLNQAKVTNVATGLAGKVSGLQINLVNNSVKPDTRITLRGNRSILGNNQALLVVDDIQLPISYIATLNPNDVENVTVLKGASASALYGSDASNGVIIVTTKKGVRGKPVIRVSSTASFETISYMPKFQNEFGQYGGENDPNQYPGIVVFPDQPYFPYVPYENQSYGPRYNGQKVPIGAPIRIFRNDGSYFIAQDSGLYSAQPNAKKGFFDNGLTLTKDVSYSSGDDKSKFFFSFQDVNAKGVVPKDVSRRDAIRVSGAKESGMFRVDYSVGYTFTNTNTTPPGGVPFSSTAGVGGGYTGGGSYFQNRQVYWTIINTPANIDLKRYRNWQTDPYASPDGYFNAYYGNPSWQIDQTRLGEKNNDILANFSVTVKPADWINFQVKATIARNDYSNKYTQAGYTFAAWAIADTLGSGNIPNGVKKLSPNEGDATSFSQRLSNEFLMSMHKTVKDFDFKFIGGTSLNVRTQRILTTSTTTLVIPDFYNISNRLGEPTVGENIAEVRRFGIFGDLTIGYKNFLFLHGSLRNDWTSLLLDPNNSYAYPAIDGSFVFTDAIKSLKGNNFLSSGKIRAAYSKTAQVSVGAYATSNTFNAGGGFPFGSVPGFSVNGSYANPNIKPEISTDKEIGLELGLLKNRILISGAVYNTSTVNQTIPITISSATGYTSAFVNSGEMTNRGYEADLRISPIVSTRSGFRWDINANYSYNKNIVQSLGYGLNSVSLGGNVAAVIGEAYPSIQANDWNRDPDGHIIINPLNGYPTLNNTPKTFGTGVPPTKIGLGTTVSYKGFSLSVVADGRFGGVILNGIGSSLDFTGVSWYSAQSGRQPFVIPNSVYLSGGKYVPNTNITTQDGNANFWASTWNQSQSNYINSADFWKIRELSLGYSFPQKLMNKAFKAISVQVTARNLFTFKAKENIWADPEFANTTGNGVGVTGLNELPPTKFVAFSLNLTF